MRLLRILVLHLQQVFESRSRVFVWFLISLLNPLIILMYWQAVFKTSTSIGAWNISDINSYYLIQVILRALLTTHPAEEIAQVHVQKGELVKYLLKPFSYLQLIFMGEFSYRLIQAIFALAIIVVLVVFFHIQLNIHISLLTLIPVFLILFFGLIISFLNEVLLGLCAFWITDYRGMQQLSEIAYIVLAGTVIPLDLFPESIANLVKVSPYASMLYYPILALQGKLVGIDVIKVLAMQSFWIVIFYLLYRFVWHKGIRMFTGVGI